MDHRTLGNIAFKNENYLEAWQEYTSGIGETPTDPVLWSNRALTNIKALHPELAVLDATRAQELFLIQQKSATDTKEHSQDIRLKAIYRYAEALATIGAHKGAAAAYTRLLGAHARTNSPMINKAECERKRDLHNGEARKNNDEAAYPWSGSYPWDTRPNNRISPQNVANLQDIMENLVGDDLVNVTVVDRTKVEEAIGGEGASWGSFFLRSFEGIRWNRQNTTNSSSSSNIKKRLKIGVVAKRDIEKGCVIFEEAQFIAANNAFVARCVECNVKLQMNNGTNYPCEQQNCTDVFCNRACYQSALASWHLPLCGQPKTQIINQNVTVSESYRILMLKVFAIAKHLDCCPLDIPQIKDATRSVPSIIIHKQMKWYSDFIPHYNVILRILKIDPYDLRYDFWVYMTVHSIIEQVIFSPDFDQQDETTALYHMASLFNHSCLPNAEKTWLSADDNKTGRVVLKAIKDIKKGQEICVSFGKIGDDLFRRQAVISTRYGFFCHCERCEDDWKNDQENRRSRTEMPGELFMPLSMSSIFMTFAGLPTSDPENSDDDVEIETEYEDDYEEIMDDDEE